MIRELIDTEVEITEVEAVVRELIDTEVEAVVGGRTITGGNGGNGGGNGGSQTFGSISF
jgi:hypothetical protein